MLEDAALHRSLSVRTLASKKTQVRDGWRGDSELPGMDAKGVGKTQCILMCSRSALCPQREESRTLGICRPFMPRSMESWITQGQNLSTRLRRAWSLRPRLRYVTRAGIWVLTAIVCRLERWSCEVLRGRMPHLRAREL